MEFYIYAYFELASCRNTVGRIPWTAIDRYAERYDVRGSNFDIFLDLIRCMERHCHKRTASDGEGG